MEPELNQVHRERAPAGVGDLNEMDGDAVCDVMTVNDGRATHAVTVAMLKACAAQFSKGTVQGTHVLGNSLLHEFPETPGAAVLVMRNFVNDVLHPAAVRHLEHEAATELLGAPGGVFAKWFLRLGAMWTQQDGAMRVCSSTDAPSSAHDVIFACRIDKAGRGRRLPGTDIRLNDGDVWVMTTLKPVFETDEQHRNRARVQSAIKKKRKIVRRSAFVR